jgi:signal peptidase II
VTSSCSQPVCSSAPEQPASPIPGKVEPGSTVQSGGVSTWRCPRAWALLITVTLLGLVLDLGSKWWAFRSLGPTPVVVVRDQVLTTRDLGNLIPFPARREIVPNLLDFTLVLNPGAVFGMGAGKRAFFIAFTVIAVGFALWMFAVWTTRKDAFSHVAIGLVLSGGLGNLYDRLTFACVRDFIHPLPGVNLPFGWSWPWGGREVWPYVSNVADLWLLIGIAILLVVMLRTPAPRDASSRSVANA